MGGSNASMLEDIRTTKRDIIMAHASFTHHFNTFLSLGEQLDNRCTEIDEREREVEVREATAKMMDQHLGDRERSCTRRQQEVDGREGEVKAKEERWAEIESVMKANAAKLPTIIKLNVSGTKFSVSKEKLLQLKGSLFEQMIVSSHPQQLPSGEIFIERDPSNFKYIIRFLLNGSLQLPSKVNKRMAIEQEFCHFRISRLVPVPVPSLPPSPVPAPVPPPIATTVPTPVPVPTPAPLARIFVSRGSLSSSLIGDDKFAEAIKEWLPQRRFELIYKASIDGFSADAFHKQCDNKGPTLTIIRSTDGYLFNGYTPLPWVSNAIDKLHADTFIFTLTNPHNIPPTKYLLKQSSHRGIRSHPSCGPIFGDAYDIITSSNSHQNNLSYTNFPSGYTDTTGHGNNTFTGAHNFTTNEIEVFAVL